MGLKAKRQKNSPRLERKSGESALKVTTVLVRDHTSMTLEDVLSAVMYSWQFTQNDVGDVEVDKPAEAG